MIRTESPRERPAMSRRRPVPARAAVGLLVAGLLATLPGSALGGARPSASVSPGPAVVATAAAAPIDPTPTSPGSSRAPPPPIPGCAAWYPG